jgi:hypothetical protein
MVTSPKGLGPEKDCTGKDQKHIQKINPSSRQRGRPTKARPKLSKSNKYLVTSSRWDSTPRVTDWLIVSRNVALTLTDKQSYWVQLILYLEVSVIRLVKNLVMKTHVRVDVYMFSWLRNLLEVSCQHRVPASLTSLNRPRYPLHGVCMGLRTSLHDVGSRKISWHYRGRTRHPSVDQPAASRFTNCAIPAALTL